MKLRPKELFRKYNNKTNWKTNLISIKIITMLIQISSFSTANAESIVCGIPVGDNILNTQNANYISLKEPKTQLEFNSKRNIANFQSPGCNKFLSVSYWTNLIEIECDVSSDEQEFNKNDETRNEQQANFSEAQEEDSLSVEETKYDQMADTEYIDDPQMPLLSA